MDYNYITMKYNSKYKNLSFDEIHIFVKRYQQILDLRKLKNKNKDARNIKNNIGRPQKIDINHVVQCLFKVISGSKLVDIIPDIKNKSSYEKKFLDMKQNNIFSLSFTEHLKELYEKGNIDMSIIHGDSTTVLNKYGVETIGFGNKYKNKKGNKVHLLQSDNGIYLSQITTSANISDTVMIDKSLNDIPFKCKSSNKKPIYITLDKGYYSKKNFDLIEYKHKYKLLCYPRKNANMQHTHNKVLFNRLKRKHNQEKYKKRFKIESSFSHIKKFDKINMRYDKKIHNYEETIFLVLFHINFVRTSEDVNVNKLQKSNFMVR